MKLSEVAEKVIELARSVREYYDVQNPKYHPHYPLIDLAEPSPPTPPEEFELRKLLGSLPEQEVLQLLLVMYLGREDFGTSDLAECFNTLRGNFSDAGHAVSQMMEKAPLAEYLSDGLEELRKNHMDIDHLPLKGMALAG